jgi:flagellar basal-body rod protein FlgF
VIHHFETFIRSRSFGTPDASILAGLERDNPEKPLMDSISISAASGMRARMESLDLLANNLANTETGGFKADREFYSIYTSAEASADAQNNNVTTLPVVEKQWTDLSAGDLRPTFNPLDLAVNGDGLFAIQTARGVRYTRNGNFRLSPAGTLTTADGNAVQSQAGTPIALDSTLPVSVLADGTVQQAGNTVGQIRMASFDTGSLSKEGANYFVAAQGAVPRPATGTLEQGKLEQSNVGAAESAVRLVSITRQFEMLQKAAGIGNDLSKQAIEQVARVVS